MIRFLHCCEGCPAEVRSDTRELPKGWTRARRSGVAIAGRPVADYCHGCAMAAVSNMPAKTQTKHRNRHAVKLALDERPTDNDAELALWIAGTGVAISPETVRRHRTALGVHPRRTRTRYGANERG